MKYGFIGQDLDILGNLLFNFFVPHFNAKSQLGLIGYVVEGTVGALMIKQHDRCIKEAFLFIASRHIVSGVLVDVNAVFVVIRHGRHCD